MLSSWPSLANTVVMLDNTENCCTYVAASVFGVGHGKKRLADALCNNKLHFSLYRMHGWRKTSQIRRRIALKTQIRRVTITSTHRRQLFICPTFRKLSFFVRRWSGLEPATCESQVWCSTNSVKTLSHKLDKIREFFTWLVCTQVARCLSGGNE